MSKDASIELIFGGRGQGKSTRAKERVKPLLRVVAYDVAHEYHEAGFTPFSSLSDLLQALALNWNKGYKLAYQPDKFADPVKELDRLCKALFEVQQPYKDGHINKEITLLVEELSRCFPNKRSDDMDGMFAAINLGRHYGLNILGLSQRPAQVHPDLRSNAAVMHFFAMNDHNDYAVIEKIVGKAGADKVRGLAPHHYMKWGNGEFKPGKNALGK